MIRSKYIKDKIKGKSFSDKCFRDYINKIVFLERSITEGVQGFAGNLHLHNLKQAYKREYEAIYQELQPEEFKRYKIEEKKENLKEINEERRLAQQERKELEQEKKQWVKLGGVL